jgi:predicted nucleotidyltransferase
MLWNKSNFPFLDDVVEFELVRLVDVLRDIIPSLNQVRVFGSYHKGGWVPPKSDVDVLALFNDERYSVDYGSTDDGYGTIAGKNWKSVRRAVDERFQSEIDFSIHLCTPGDVNHLWNYQERGKGRLGKSMMQGRLLYQVESGFSLKKLVFRRQTP